MLLDVTGIVPPMASMLPFDSVVIVFSRMMPVIPSRIIFPLLALFIVVVASRPIIIVFEIVVPVLLKSITIVESFISDKV